MNREAGGRLEVWGSWGEEGVGRPVQTEKYIAWQTLVDGYETGIIEVEGIPTIPILLVIICHRASSQVS